MNKFNSKIACGVLSGCLIAGCFTGCGKLDGTQTVATVDGEEVTLGLASYILRDQQAQISSYYQMFSQSYGIDVGDMWGEEAEDGKTYAESTKEGVMDTIKTLYVMKDHAADYDVRITDEEQEAIDSAAKAFMEANDEKTLEELAVSESDIVLYLQLMTYRQKMHDPMVADVDQEVSDDEANQTRISLVTVSTEDGEDDDGNPVPLTEEEKAEKKELAEKVLEKIKASDNIAEADIDAIVDEVDDSIRSTTPAFTTAPSESNTLDQAVMDAALKLKDGEVADKVIEGEKGYYVVRLDKMYDEEATQNKIKSIISEREQELYDSLLEKWEDAADMNIQESVWKKVKLSDAKSFVYKTADATEDAAE